MSRDTGAPLASADFVPRELARSAPAGAWHRTRPIRAAVGRGPYDRDVPTGDELRTVMRRFPAGVAVLTVDDEGARHGITVGSLLSLSLDPVLVAVSLGRDTIAHGLVRNAGGYSVSMLAGDQIHLAQHFARSVPPIAQWEGIAVKADWRGPLLEGALGWLDCRTSAEYPGGDHTIFVGEVERLELGAGGDGLIYREGRFVAVD